jgi:HEAT repeat protein
MATTSELRQLLSLVQFDARQNCIEGLTAFRNLLEHDSDGSIVQFLNREMPKLESKRRAGIAYVLAEHYRQIGNLKCLQQVYASDDSEVQASVLNALWGQPGSNPEMGPGIVRVAIDATCHVAPEVRAEACSVIQNQCGWKVDVSTAVAPLLRLLEDESARVRMQAACAVGNLAKSKYDVLLHVVPLGHNVRHEDAAVRNYSAWALWQISRGKHDIGNAVPELVQLLTDDDDCNDPRKHAVGALLHHAQKASGNLEQVRRCLKAVSLDAKYKQVQRFQEQLAVME